MALSFAHKDAEEYEDLDRTTPTLEEIKALRRVQELLKGKPAVAKLRWIKITKTVEDEYGETGETKKAAHAEIRVTVTACGPGRCVPVH